MQQILQGTGSIIVYFVIAAGGALGSRCFIKIPNELFLFYNPGDVINQNF